MGPVRRNTLALGALLPLALTQAFFSGAPAVKPSLQHHTPAAAPAAVAGACKACASRRRAQAALCSAAGTAEADPFTTELPDSFEQSVDHMAEDIMRALDTGARCVRVDFDTSAGDETYTLLKQSLPMAQLLLARIAPRLGGAETAAETAETATGGGETAGQAQAARVLRVFFPDAGTAALMARDWKAGTEGSVVPANVAFAGMRRDSPEPTDAGILVLCPRNSEADDTLRLLEEAEANGQFMVLVNPELVNMATTGYGLAGRRIRDRVLATFTSAYYLRTLQWGAVTKRLGKSFSVWQDDESAPGGYRLLRNMDAKPTFEDLEEIYDEENGLSTPTDTPAFLNAFADFVRDFGRL